MTELDKKLDKILDDFSTWDKCGNFECQHYLNYLDSIDQLKSLIKEVCEVVIGEDEAKPIVTKYNRDKFGRPRLATGESWSKTKGRNELRAEQRDKLNKILGEQNIE